MKQASHCRPSGRSRARGFVIVVDASRLRACPPLVSAAIHANLSEGSVSAGDKLATFARNKIFQMLASTVFVLSTRLLTPAAYLDAWLVSTLGLAGVLLFGRSV